MNRFNGARRHAAAAPTSLDATMTEEPDGGLMRAYELLRLGRAADALAWLSQHEPNAAEAEARVEHVALQCWALSELDRHDEALRLVDAALEELPDAARLHAARGVVLCSAGDLPAARRSLQAALQHDPRDTVALSNLAVVVAELGDPGQALQILDKLAALGADLDWLLPRQATVLAELGRRDEAKGALRRYLSLAADDAGEWMSLAILHSDDQEYPQAFECFRAAEQITPDSAALRLNWGVCAVRAGDEEIARRQLAYLERLEPDSSRPRLLRAFVLEQWGGADEARRQYEEALAGVPRDNREELTYAFEMAMDFFVRHKQRPRCEALLAEAYAANACTAEVCERFRELSGEPVRRASWFNLLVEADWRPGLAQVVEHGAPSDGPFKRFRRNCQIVARNRDDAVASVLQFLKRMGEKAAQVRTIVDEEPIEDTFTGLYEVETTVLVIAERTPRA